MSILIKGMEMPKPKSTDMVTVYDAYVLVRQNGRAAIIVDDEDGLDSTEYPLVPIPSHGDLIDRDALKEAICSRLSIKSEKYLLPEEATIVNEIFAAPTVIEAEEEKV